MAANGAFLNAKESFVHPSKQSRIVISRSTDHHRIHLLKMSLKIIQLLDAAVDLNLQLRKLSLQPIDILVPQRWHIPILLRAVIKIIPLTNAHELPFLLSLFNFNIIEARLAGRTEQANSNNRLSCSRGNSQPAKMSLPRLRVFERPNRVNIQILSFFVIERNRR